MNELKSNFTEKEGLLFLIDKGIPKAEEKLNSFEKHNKLKTKSQIKAFVESLEMYLHDVNYSGEGQSREYSHKGLKESATKRITGNAKNGRKLTDNDEIMKEYLFKLLCYKDAKRKAANEEDLGFDIKRDYTINQLIELLNVIPAASNEDSSSIHRELKEVFQGYYDADLITYMQRNITSNLDSRKRDDIKLFIRHLVKEDRIEVNPLYYVKYLGDSEKLESIRKDEIWKAKFEMRQPELISPFQKISELEFIELDESIKEIVSEHGFTYQEYIQASMNLIKVDSYIKDMLDDVKSYLRRFQYDFIYKSLDITILKSESAIEIKLEEAKRAFENKIILLTNNRMNKEEYSNKTEYLKEFYRLSMFIYLRKLKVNGLDDEIQKEITQIAKTYNEMSYVYGKKQAEQSEERTVFGFGVNSADPLKREIPAELKNIDITQLFEDKMQQEVKVLKDAAKPAIVNSEIEWMDRILAVKKDKRVAAKPIRAKSQFTKPIITGNMIDIEAIIEEPEPVKVKKQYNRIFGSTFVIRNEIEMKEFAVNE